MKKHVPAILAAAVSLLLVLGPTLAQSTAFVETYDGRPAAPEPWDLGRWSVFTFGVDSRQPNLAQHGPACEPPGFPYAPGNSHGFSTDRQATFICNDHLMTSLGITGYGAVYMTPPAVADLRGGSARINWDMSTLRTSSRDWVYVVLTPFGEQHDMAWRGGDSHIPPHNIKIELGGTNTFILSQYVNGREVRLPQQDDSTTWNQVFAAQSPSVTESAIRRDTFEITLTRTSISLCMPSYAYRGVQPFCWARETRLAEPLDPAVWRDQVTVQLTHVTYNAEKACEDAAIAAGVNPLLDQWNIVHNPYGDLHCPPNTWHWDNTTISPALPFRVIQTDPPGRVLTSARPTEVRFLEGAPAGANLSFVSFGDTPRLRVSWDGVNWITPRLQPSTTTFTEIGEQVWMPMPEGQRSVWVQGANGFWGTFEASAFKIVGQPGGLPPAGTTPTPTRTLTPTGTGVSQTATPTLGITPIPTNATSIPTESPTASPTATATVEPTLTPTVAPEVTPSPTPLPCIVQVWINGVAREPVPC